MKKLLPLFCTLLLCGCHLSIDIGPTTYNYDDEDFEKGNATFATSNLDSLNIDWIAGNVKIVYYDGTEIKIEEDEEDLMSSQMLRYYYNKNDNELFIKFCKANIEDKKIKNLKKDLTIYLPQDSKIRSLDYDGVSANLTIDNVCCKKCDIDTVSGNITIASRIAAQKCEIDSISGKTYLYFPNDIAGFYIDFDTISGDVNYDSSDFPGIKSKDGNLSYGDKSSEFNVDTTSGDIYIKLLSDYSN